MGLDMYLNVSESISDYNYSRVNGEVTRKQNPAYSNIIAATGIKVPNMAPSISVEYTAIYWRKANQIHNWFVNTLADGVDECQTIRVTRDNLVALHDRCSVLLDTKSNELAADLLPPASGFFFGSTTIDEWYWQDIEETHQQLTELLDKITEENKWDYKIEYGASW